MVTRDGSMTRRREVRLNPFFIRSAVGMGRQDRGSQEPRVLIPASSGLRLESPGKRMRLVRIRLNPFFILRSAVGMHDELQRDGEVRLNPFFIRSAVGICQVCVGWSYTRVLIPSSSGLRLECPGSRRSARRSSLNPFFIRSAVGMRGHAGGVSDEEVLILLHQVCGWNRRPNGRNDKTGKS